MLPSPYEIDAAMYGHGSEPRPKPRRILQLLQPLECFDENLLRNILRITEASETGQRNPKHGIPVFVHNRPKAIPAISQGLRYKLSIFNMFRQCSSSLWHIDARWGEKVRLRHGESAS